MGPAWPTTITLWNITLGISVLRATALRAEIEGRKKIELEHLENLLPKHPKDLELTEDGRVIMRILREKHSIAHKQLYNLYCQSANSPKQERTSRDYMQRLIAKSLVRIDFSNGLQMYVVAESG